MKYTKINKIIYNLDGGKIKKGSVFEEFVSTDPDNDSNLIISANIININEGTVIPLPQFFDVENGTNCLVGWVISDAKNTSTVYTVELYGSNLDSDLKTNGFTEDIATVRLKAIYTTTQNTFKLDESNITLVEKYSTNRKLSDKNKNGEYYFENSDIKLALPTEKVAFFALENEKGIEKPNTISLLGDRTLSGLPLYEKLKGEYDGLNQIVIYKRNNNVLLPSDIINHNDFIIGSIKEKSRTKLSVLPCVYKKSFNDNKEQIAEIDTKDSESIAATNYGSTYVWSKETKEVVFNSDTATAEANYHSTFLGVNFILCAEPKENCIFIGWYRRRKKTTDSNKNTIITYIPLANNQQIEILALAPLCEYAAVFAKYSNVEGKQEQIDFPNE